MKWYPRWKRSGGGFLNFNSLTTEENIMKAKISGAAICYEKLDKASDDQVVNVKWLRIGHTQTMSEGAAYNVTWVLKNSGALIPVPSTGPVVDYTINRAKLNEYFDQKTPFSPYFQARKQTGKVTRQLDNTLQAAAALATPESNIDDVEVIDNLLDAMAAAESVLNKIKRIAEAMHS